MRNESDEAADEARDAELDAAIAHIDALLSAQERVILHHPDFQRLESAWRGLEFLVNHVDFRENIRVELLNITKEELARDVRAPGGVERSALHHIVYDRGFREVDGEPYGLLVGEYWFDASDEDVATLDGVAQVAAKAHAPFLASTAPAMVGLTSWEQLPALKNLERLFQGPQYARWQSFREGEDSRYVGLTLPRIVLRLPYGANTVPTKSFAFEEQVEGAHDGYLWGNAAVALATRVADSFAKYRWCPNIIGPHAGGAVEDLPLHQYVAMGEIQTKISTECQLTERREYELSEQGFIGLGFLKDSNQACFFSANSVQKVKHFGESPEGRAAETSYRLSTQLPYLFMVARFAHYLKVVKRASIGVWMVRGEIERGLNEWIRDHVFDMDDVAPRRWKRPLMRKAKIQVEETEGKLGQYRLALELVLNVLYMGRPINLSLGGVIDRE